MSSFQLNPLDTAIYILDIQMVDVLCFDSKYNCCLHHLEQEKWNRYAFEYNKHNSVLYRIIYLLPIQTHIAEVTENDTIIDVHTIRLDCELNIMDSTSYRFISIQCCILLALTIFEMKIIFLLFFTHFSWKLYHKNYNYLNTWRTYQSAKLYIWQYYLND